MNNPFITRCITAYEEEGGHSCSGLTPMHKERCLALATLKREGLPQFKSEAYQRTDLNLFFPDTLPIIGQEQGGALATTPTHLALEGAVYTIGNGRYDELFSSPLALPKGAFIGSFTQFQKIHPEVFAQYYAQLAKSDRDGIVALNTLLAETGFAVYLPKGIKLEAPIHLSEIYGAAEGTTFSTHRLLVILEEESEIEINNAITSATQEGESTFVRVSELFIGRGAKLRYNCIEKTNNLTAHISSLHSRQEEESTCEISNFTISNGRTRCNYDCDLAGEYATLSLGGLAFVSGQNHVDNYSYIAHSVPHCQSDELFKYILADEAYGVFTGKILVALDAQKTQAYQNNRNLLLSPKARMQAKPQLEIYADDVKCSHGMTTGQLDQNALFYLRQRGIGLGEAKLLLSIAFTEDAIRLVEDEKLEEYLRELVAERFRSINF